MTLTPEQIAADEKQKPLDLEAVKGRADRGYYDPTIAGCWQLGESMTVMKDVRAMAVEIERLRAVQDLVDPLIGGIIHNYANPDLTHEAFRVRAYMEALKVRDVITTPEKDSGR